MPGPMVRSPKACDEVVCHRHDDVLAMRFAYPCFPAEFEIPDAWWIEAGMLGFMPKSNGYRSAIGTQTIPVRDIEPPFRNSEVPMDFCGFDRIRLVRIFKGFVAGDEIEAVSVLILPPIPDISKPPFKYRVVDGLHRFYASVAAGFKHLPADAFGCRS